MTEARRRIWGLEAAVPPNTHFRGMTPEQIEVLTPEEKAVLNIAAFWRGCSNLLLQWNRKGEGSVVGAVIHAHHVQVSFSGD